MTLIKNLYILVLGFAISLNCYSLQPNDSISIDSNKEDIDNKKDIDNKEFIKAKGCIRLLSYNIKHCEGMDNVINYDRTASVIRSLNPDVVCLQELDSITSRCNDFQVKVLGEKLGMHGYFGPAIPYKGGKYGLGILSNEIPVRIYHYSLPGVEKRTFMIAEFSNYIVICTHLDLNESNRVESVKIITQKAKEFTKRIYLAGDFNEENKKGSVFTEFSKNWEQVSLTNNTFPTGAPTKCIDYILTFKQKKSGFKIKNANVVYNLQNVNVSSVSDHYPIYIDFK